MLGYLACPFTHPDAAVREARLALVTYAAYTYIKQGRWVYSPLTHNAPIALQNNMSGDWKTWEAFDNVMIEKCDHLLVLQLPGWAESVGVTAEVKHAEKLGLDVQYIDPSEISWPAALQGSVHMLLGSVAEE